LDNSGGIGQNTQYIHFTLGIFIRHSVPDFPRLYKTIAQIKVSRRQFPVVPRRPELRVLSLVIEDIGSPVLAPISADQGLAPSAPLRTLQRNEMLFEAGDLKTHLYRIETGAICIYVTHPNKAISSAWVFSSGTRPAHAP
jgi:hypothetical protein